MEKWAVKWTGVLLLVMVIVPCGLAQWTTRDPRFYSREGVHDYNPPSPGDPEYRWVSGINIQSVGWANLMIFPGPTPSTTGDMATTSQMDTDDNIRVRIPPISTRRGRHWARIALNMIRWVEGRERGIILFIQERWLLVDRSELWKKTIIMRRDNFNKGGSILSVTRQDFSQRMIFRQVKFTFKDRYL